MLTCFHAALSRACRLLAMVIMLWLGHASAHAQEVITLPTFFEMTQNNTTIGSVTLTQDSLLDTKIVTLIDGQIQYNLQNATAPNTGYVFNYVGVEFTVSQTSTYYFGQSKAPVDTLMLLYKDSFDPSKITQNLVAANDDWYRFKDSTGRSLVTNFTDPDCAYATDSPYFQQLRCIALPGYLLKLEKCGNGGRTCPGMFTTLDPGKYFIIITTYKSVDSKNLSVPETFWCYGGSCTFTKTVTPPKPAEPDPVTPPAPTNPNPPDKTVPDPPAPPTTPVDTTPKGPNPLFTMLSVQDAGSALQRVLAQRSSLTANVTEFDCTSFGKDGFCVSFRLRSSTTASQSEGGGLMTLGYRLTSQLRAGLIADLVVTAKDPAGFEFRDERPTVGGFIVYGSPDHRGFATKLSGAWQTTVVRYTRGSYFETESGSGKAAISGSSGRAEISYGFAPRHEVRITPFAAVRRTITGRSSYREDQTDTVLSPLSFLPFIMQSSTAIAGLRVAGMVSNDIGVMLGMSVERDLAQHRSMMNASSASPDIPVMNLSLGNALRATALAANLGLSWEVAPKQYLTAQANLRGQLGLPSPSLTTLLGYQVSF